MVKLKKCNTDITWIGMFMHPKKSSWLPDRALCAICLKNLPRPLTPLTSFNLLTASSTEDSSSWSLYTYDKQTISTVVRRMKSTKQLETKSSFHRNEKRLTGILVYPPLSANFLFAKGNLKTAPKDQNNREKVNTSFQFA